MALDIVTLSIHANYALQPLDVVCFKPFMNALWENRDCWNLANNHVELQGVDLFSSGLQKRSNMHSYYTKYKQYLRRLNMTNLIVYFSKGSITFGYYLGYYCIYLTSYFHC